MVRLNFLRIATMSLVVIGFGWRAVGMPYSPPAPPPNPRQVPIEHALPLDESADPNYFWPSQGLGQTLQVPYFGGDKSSVFRAKLVWRANPRLCVTVPGGFLTEGAVLQANPCVANAPEQTFVLSMARRGQVVAKGGEFSQRGYSMCVDYWNSSQADGGPGTPIRIWPCHPLTVGKPDSQVWRPIDADQLRTSNTGMCMVADGLGTIRLAACDRNWYSYCNYNKFRHTPQDLVVTPNLGYSGQGLAALAQYDLPDSPRTCDGRTR
jgi:hypothetical protein